MKTMIADTGSRTHASRGRSRLGWWRTRVCCAFLPAGRSGGCCAARPDHLGCVNATRSCSVGGWGLGSDSAWPSVWALREYAQGRDVCRWSLRMLIPPASYSERAGGACGAPRNTTQREERARSIPGAGRAHGCWSHAWCRHSPRLCPGCQISGCVAWLHKLQRRDSQQDLGVN
jgi:hypothetical protein